MLKGLFQSIVPLISSYNGVPTVANGIPAEYAQINLTGQTAAITTTTLYAVPGTGAGLYRATISLIVTTVGTAGTITASLTNNNGTTSQTQTTSTLSVTTTGELTTTIECYSATSQNIQYNTTFNSVTGTPAYSLRIRLEYLG